MHLQRRDEGTRRGWRSLGTIRADELHALLDAAGLARNRLKLRHPATFPDKLAEDLILCFSDEGDLLLDPMCGSGTTPAMAKRHRRRSLGIEIGPGYAAIARTRLRREVAGSVTSPVSVASPRR